MSDLLTNLNSIYNTKLQIKNVINTSSDDFTQYPSLIEEAISGGASGTTYITTNGTFNVSSYAYADVDVPATIPPGYTYVSGTTYAVASGLTYCADSAFVYISWPVPTGTYYTTVNGTHNVYGYNYVNVDVSGGGGSAYEISQSVIYSPDDYMMANPTYMTKSGNYYTYNYHYSYTSGWPGGSAQSAWMPKVVATIDSVEEKLMSNTMASDPNGNGTYTTSALTPSWNNMFSMTALDFSGLGSIWKGDLDITMKLGDKIGLNGWDLQYEYVVSNYEKLSPGPTPPTPSKDGMYLVQGVAGSEVYTKMTQDMSSGSTYYSTYIMDTTNTASIQTYTTGMLMSTYRPMSITTLDSTYTSTNKLVLQTTGAGILNFSPSISGYKLNAEYSTGGIDVWITNY